MTEPKPPRNDSLLFSPDSDMDLLFAVLGLIVLLGVTVGPALSELSDERLDLAVALLTLVGLPALVNLLRYKRAPWGCAVLPTGFLLYALALFGFDLGGVVATLFLGVPNLLFLGYELGVKPVLAWRDAETALSRIQAEGTPPSELSLLLGHAAERVRLAASAALAAHPPAQVIVELRPALRSESAPHRGAALLTVRALAADAANRPILHEVLAELAQEKDPDLAAGAARELPGVETEGELLSDLANDERFEVRLGLAQGLLRVGADVDLTAKLLCDLLGDGEAAPGQRVEVLDSTDPTDVDPSHVAALGKRLPAHLLRCMDAGNATPELMWAVAEHGDSEHALRAAALVGSTDATLAGASLEALEGILVRGVDLGQRAVAIRTALSEASAKLREAHPKGENGLADRIVVRAGRVLKGLGA